MMKRKSDKYAGYADHPRYGRRPNITGLNPNPVDRDVHLHWNTASLREVFAHFQSIVGREILKGGSSSFSKHSSRIANTAIVADISRQTLATVQVTHYFDLDRQCRECERPFIFFAEEQKHWYEELGFGLEADCVRCFECRKKQRGIARQREIYESLFHVPDKTEEQVLQMAEACLNLIEAGVFSSQQTVLVRRLLNSLPDNFEIRERKCFADLVARVLAAEK